VTQPKLYHIGFRDAVARDALAHAYEVLNWRIYADFVRGLISTARTLYTTEYFEVDLDQAGESPGCHRYLLVPGAVHVGHVPHAQGGGCEAAHLAEPVGQHPHCPVHFARARV
jgi:hypothetical protein